MEFERPDASRWDVPQERDAEPRRVEAEAWQREREKRERVREAAARLFAEHGPGGVSRRTILDAAGVHYSQSDRLFGSVGAILGEVLSEHVHGLGAAVDAAFAAGEELGEMGRLERVVRAWIEFAAGHEAAHRVLATCLMILEPVDRARVGERLNIALGTVGEALRALVGLEAVPEGLGRAMRRLLVDGWADESGPDERREMARRIAGMLACGAVAEGTGLWPGLGPVEGAVRQEVVESAVVRLRFGEVVAFAASGGEVLVRRYGRVVAKVVGANVVQDSGFGG